MGKVASCMAVVITDRAQIRPRLHNTHPWVVIVVQSGDSFVQCDASFIAQGTANDAQGSAFGPNFEATMSHTRSRFIESFERRTMRLTRDIPEKSQPNPLTPFALTAVGSAVLLGVFGALTGGWLGLCASALAIIQLLIALAAIVTQHLARRGAAAATRARGEFADQFELAFNRARNLSFAAIAMHFVAGLMLAGLLASLATRWIGGALSAGIAVFLGAGALMLLVAVMSRPLRALATLNGTPELPQPYVELKPDNSPALWDALTALADEMQTGYVERVFLGREPGVYMLGRSLYVSLATLRVSNMDELGALLAHEFAHSYDDAPHTLMLRLHRIATARLANTHATRWFLTLIDGVLQRFAPAAEAANRERELDADRAAARIVGPDATGAALTRALIAELWWERAQQGAQAGGNVFEQFESVARAGLDVPDVGALNQRRAAHPRDVHPSHLVRMTTLQIVTKSALAMALAVAPPGDTAIQLITDHEAIEMQLSSTPSRKPAKRAARTTSPSQAPSDDVENAADSKRGLVVAAARGARMRMIGLTAGSGGFLALIAALLVLNVLGDLFSGLLRSGMLFVLLVAGALGGLAALLFRTARNYWAQIQANVPALRATSKGVRVYTEIANGDLLRWSELGDLKVEEIEMAGLTQTLFLVPNHPKTVLNRLSLPRRLMFMAMGSVLKAPHFIGSGHVALPITDVYRLLANYYKMNILDGAVDLRSAQGPADTIAQIDDATTDFGNAQVDSAPEPLDAHIPEPPAQMDESVFARPSHISMPAQPVSAPQPPSAQPLQAVDGVPSAGPMHPLIALAGESAQSTLDVFVDALQNNPDDKRMVRAIRVTAPDDSGELVWLANVSIEDMDEGIFAGGVVDGPHPFAAPPGQRVNVSHDMIIDWLLARDRVAQGGFTLRAERMLIDPADRQLFDDAIKHSFSNDLIGFDFDARLQEALSVRS